jgi:ribosomal protein S21
MVEQRGNEPLASALRTAKMAFSWTTLLSMKNRHFRQKPEQKRSRERDFNRYELRPSSTDINEFWQRVGNGNWSDGEESHLV